MTAHDSYLYHRTASHTASTSYYDVTHWSAPATSPTTLTLQVNICVIDFLNYYKTHEIIDQLRQIIPHVTITENILINKQVENACGYVSANVASQSTLLFHTSASTIDGTYRIM